MQAAAIPFPSKRKALDASLVLLSQGIDSLVEMPTDDHGWQLVIDESHVSKALDALERYHKENKSRHRPQTLPWTDLLFDWRGVAWFLLCTIIFILCQTEMPGLRLEGRMDSQAVAHGEWWRLFTAVSLHADLEHLLANVTIGVLLLGFAMGAFGSGIALLATFLAGAGANLVGYWVYSDSHLGLGASGMVMAALGLLAAQSLAHLKAGLHAAQLALRGLFGGILLLALFGFNPDSDILAHLAGFALGVVMGGILALLAPLLPRRKLPNRLAELLCAILIATTWYFALR